MTRKAPTNTRHGRLLATADRMQHQESPVFTVSELQEYAHAISAEAKRNAEENNFGGDTQFALHYDRSALDRYLRTIGYAVSGSVGPYATPEGYVFVHAALTTSDGWMWTAWTPELIPFETTRQDIVSDPETFNESQRQAISEAADVDKLLASSAQGAAG